MAKNRRAGPRGARSRHRGRCSGLCGTRRRRGTPRLGERSHAPPEGAADVNIAQIDGTTALHWAVFHDDAEAVRLLVRARANVNAVNRYGVPPLALASTSGNAAIVALFLEAGADANATMKGDETVLMLAARSGNSNETERKAQRQYLGANLGKFTARVAQFLLIDKGTASTASTASFDDIVLGFEFDDGTLGSCGLFSECLKPLLQPVTRAPIGLVLGVQLIENVCIRHRICDFHGQFRIVGVKVNS